MLESGRKALGDLLLRLHVWRVTANVEAFRVHLEGIAIDEHWLGIRAIVRARKLNSWMFVQPNTFLTEDGTDVVMKEYDESPRGMIESWSERFSYINRLHNLSVYVAQVFLQLRDYDFITPMLGDALTGVIKILHLRFRF